MEAKWPFSDFFMDNSTMAAMVVDQSGKIVFINRTYLNILGMPERDVLGKYIGDITPESRTLLVIRTGKAIVGYNWSINGYNMIACALPLIKNDIVVGCFAYSLFMDIWDAKDLAENLMFELNMYKEEVRSLYSARYTFKDIIGDSQRLQNVIFLAQKAALHASTTVLITGESGTGKELFAQAIHNCGSRSSFPFVRVNCAAIPETLLESELFGYADGAYTGAKKGGSPGKFELANGGTVFLDEITEMSFSMQSKLLVVLQEREFERLGSNQPIRINVRIIAATNRDLESMVEQNRFREDLYYRLNVLRLEIPPLRDRTADIPLLVNSLIPKMNASLRTKITGVDREAMEIFARHLWPGNVRELQNVLERAIILADMEGASSIGNRHLAFMKGSLDCHCKETRGSLKDVMDDFEKRYIEKVLEESGHNKHKAAKALDIDVSWLYKKLKKYGCR